MPSKAWSFVLRKPCQDDLINWTIAFFSRTKPSWLDPNATVVIQTPARGKEHYTLYHLNPVKDRVERLRPIPISEFRL